MNKFLLLLSFTFMLSSCKTKDIDKCQGITLNKLLFKKSRPNKPQLTTVNFLIRPQKFDQLYINSEFQFYFKNEKEFFARKFLIDKPLGDLDLRYMYPLYKKIEFEELENISVAIQFGDCVCKVEKSDDFIICGTDYIEPCPLTRIDSLNGIN